MFWIERTVPVPSDLGEAVADAMLASGTRAGPWPTTGGPLKDASPRPESRRLTLPERFQPPPLAADSQLAALFRELDAAVSAGDGLRAAEMPGEIRRWDVGA